MSTREPRDLPAPSPSSIPRPRSVVQIEEARVYARLLVSDVRLYHEEEVLEGRARRDLAARLSESIAAARSRFLRRFEDETIFDGEVVRVLAGGDPGKLG